MLRVVSERAPTWSPRFVDEMIADRVYAEVLAFAWAVKNDQDHAMRKALDTFLVEFANDLQFDPETIDRVEQVKQQFFAHPEVQSVHRQGLVDDQDDDPGRRRRPVLASCAGGWPTG